MSEPRVCEQKQAGPGTDEPCREPAAARMFWPGSPPRQICSGHRQGAEKIARVLGIYLHFEPVADAAEGRGKP